MEMHSSPAFTCNRHTHPQVWFRGMTAGLAARRPHNATFRVWKFGRSPRHFLLEAFPPQPTTPPPFSTVIVYSAPPSPLNSAPTPVNCNHGLHPARRNLSLDGQQRTTDATRPYPPVEVAAPPAPCDVTLVTAGALSELNFTETRPGTSNRWRKFPSRSWLARGLLRLFPSPFRLPWYAEVSANLFAVTPVV